MTVARRCFRRHCDEEHATYLFQTEASGVVSQQVEIYDDGRVLVYDAGHLADEHGALTDQPIDLADFAPFEIAPEAYDAELARLEPFNR